MKRIVFEGNDLKGLSSDQNGFYVKLMIPTASGNFLSKPKVRTYTIRKYDERANEMIIDFAMHEPAGPATGWALTAKPGDEIRMMGPGPKKVDTSRGGWYLFVADMSAIPAAFAAIESLPESAEGEAFFEVQSKEDIQQLAKPNGLTIHWLVNSEPHVVSNQQLNAIQELEIPDSPNVFVAGELNAVRSVKEFLMGIDNVVNSSNVYISSYWKIGKSEEEHKKDKVSLKS